MVKLVCLGLFSFALSSCEWGYYLKSAVHHTELLYHQIPVEEALEKNELPEREKKKLLLTQEVREFAKNDLGLNVGGNYQNFIDLKGRAVSYVVSASEKWKLEPFLWQFLFVGRVPYKGFYDESEARAEADMLKKKDLDVYVRGVGAFSTLGLLQDPVVSSMLSEDDDDLADTLIHESVHATIYIKSSADFNEQLAVYLGGLGARRFYEKKEGKDSPTVQLIEDKKTDEQLFSSFMKREAEELKTWYAEQKIHDENLRQIRFSQIEIHFRSLVLPKLRTEAYRTFFKRPVNNARILLSQTYTNDLSEFEKFAAARDYDFRRILHDVVQFKSSADPFAELKRENSLPHH